MPSRGRVASKQAKRTARLASLASLAVLAAACSFSSLDGYFECPVGQKQCKDPPGDAGVGASSVGGAAGNAASSGDGGPGGSADAGGLGAEAGSTVLSGDAGPGDACTVNGDCAQGICARGVCGDEFEVTYSDAADKGDPPTAAKWIKFQFQIENRTAASVPFSSLTVRYYYSPDNVVSEFAVLTVGAPPGSNALVTGTIGQTQESGTLHWTYAEVGFASGAGNLGSEQSSGLIKVGVHDQDFGPGTFYELDDYSYMQPTHITVYYDGKLVSGIEPPPRTQ